MKPVARKTGLMALAATLAITAATLTGVGVGTNAFDAHPCVAPHNVGLAVIQLACPPPGATTTTTAGGTTTTTAGGTTTTTSGGTTTTTVGGTTTTTTAGGGTSFPSTANTGVPAGITLTAYTGPSTISTCQTINAKLITTALTITATNGKAAVYGSEATAKANACVIFTDDRIAPPAGSCNAGCGGIKTTAFDSTEGPVFVADTEISMPQTVAAGQNNGGYAMCCTNFHVWRVWGHGAPQGLWTDGYTEMHDSLMQANLGSADNSAHMDAFFIDGGDGLGAASGTDIEHNTLTCHDANGAGSGGCSADVGIFNDNTPDVQNVTLNDNFLSASTGDYFYCMYTGTGTQTGGGPTAFNITVSNNVFAKGASGKCGDAGAVYPLNTFGTAGNTFTGNVFDDGTAVPA